MNLVDLKNQLDGERVRKLLSLASGYPTEERLNQICDKYRRMHNWHLLGYEVDGHIIGCIGIEFVGNQQGAIRHLAVCGPVRRKGIGRSMVETARAMLGLNRLVAGTDADAEGFYRRCGFEIESLGETYPGIERFRCKWPADTETIS